MLIIMTSPDAVWVGGRPDPQIVNLLIAAKAAQNPVDLISNHPEPKWFKEVFGTSKVQYLQVKGRQDGKIVAQSAQKFNLNPYDVLVLATKGEDIMMGKNGGGILVAAGWSTDATVTDLGIRVDNAQQLQEVIDLTTGWSGHWWFMANKPRYNVRVLADLSGYAVSEEQHEFGKRLTNTVKDGGSRLNALLAVTARSLMTDGTISKENLFWGVYPSSASENNDTEVLSDFTHRLRTTVSRVRLAKRDEPLFIRHRASSKRSKGGGGDRNDPTEQILTIHLNPFYKKSLKGKNVIVIDDCTTYGVSFGVAAAFLLKAGASSVTGVALGKFGNQIKYHSIDINSDPFSPVLDGGFVAELPTAFTGAVNYSAQRSLRELIP